MHLNITMSNAAFWLALAQLPFIINVFFAWKSGKKVENDNPLECHHSRVGHTDPSGAWQLHLRCLLSIRGPYEYSRPDCEDDYMPQWH